MIPSPTQLILERLAKLEEAFAGVNGGPFIDQKTNAIKCLHEMFDQQPKLYEKCISTIGFAFGFSQLANRAVRFDELLNEAAWLHKTLRECVLALDAECPCINNYPDGQCRCGIQDVLKRAAGRGE